MNRGRFSRSSAFTIVELLIVIVVIGILAAIIAVGYGSVTEQARRNAAQTNLKQLGEQLALYGWKNSQTLPTALEDAGITAPDGTTYGYRTYDYGTQYCLSITEGGSSYYVNSTNSGEVGEGACSDAESVDVPGTLLATNDQPGTIVPFSEVSGTPDVVLYAVFDVIDTTGAYNAIAVMSPSSSDNQRMWLDTAAAGTTTLRFRIDTTVETNVTAAQSGARTPGRHVGWLQVRGGMTIREFAYDKASAHSSGTLLPSGGWSFTGLQLQSGTSTQPVVAVAYEGAHDEQARTRVLSWLIDTYDVPLSL